MGYFMIILEGCLLPIIFCQWCTVPCLLCWGQPMQTGIASLLHFWPAGCLCFLSTCINIGSLAQVFMYNKINSISQHSFCLWLNGIIKKHFSFIPLYSFCMQEKLNRYKKKNSATVLSVLGHLAFSSWSWPLLGRSDVFQWKAGGNENNPVEKEKRNIFPSLLVYIPLGLSRSLYCILNMQ